MIERALLDTDILSELMRGKNETVRARAEAYVRVHGRLSVSVITVLEIVKGLQKAGRKDAMDRFIGALDSVEVIDLARPEASIAGRIYGDLERLGQPIGRADPMIAGTALAQGLVLATGNEEHYRRICALGYALTIDNWRNAAPDEP